MTILYQNFDIIILLLLEKKMSKSIMKVKYRRRCKRCRRIRGNSSNAFCATCQRQIDHYEIEESRQEGRDTMKSIYGRRLTGGL